MTDTYKKLFEEMRNENFTPFYNASGSSFLDYEKLESFIRTHTIPKKECERLVEQAQKKGYEKAGLDCKNHNEEINEKIIAQARDYTIAEEAKNCYEHSEKEVEKFSKAVENQIVEEILIAQKEGQPTSRLTSLFMWLREREIKNDNEKNQHTKKLL